MSQRMNLAEVVPDGYRAVLGLEAYVRRRVPGGLLHLVKLRASVLNGCAYCVQMHSRDALAAGEAAERLFAVSAWRESDLFDERERATLALTDAVTLLGDHGVPDEVWDQARSWWSEEELADLLLAIAIINVWTRIAVTTRMPPSLA